MAAEVLIVLALAFVVVTVVGHGMWILLAALFRTIFAADQPAHVARDCPACGKRQAIVAGHCRSCGATPFIRPAPQPAPRNESRIIIRRMQELLADGSITRAEFEKLTTLVRGDNAPPFATATSTGAPVVENSGVGDELADRSAPKTSTLEPDAAAQAKMPSAAPTESSDEEEFVELEIVEAEVVDEPEGPGPSLARRPATISTHPLDRPDPPPSPPQVSVPRRTLAALLQTFMDDKNIRWGEIISGLLIIVCAVGLVVSLWATLRDSIPYLPALIFLIGTAAFHAAGHYTLRSWDLSSISRAVLIIATLLIPLNFLAAIALSGEADDLKTAIDPIYVAAVVVGLIAYGTMTFFAGRVFLGVDWWRLLAGVMGPCAGQLLINRLAHEGDSGLHILLLMLLPLAGFLVAAVSGLLRAQKWKRLSMPRAERLLLVLGISTFSLLCAIALLVAKSQTVWAMLAQLSPTLSLVAGAALATGLLIHQRTTLAKLFALRTAGTSLAIAAAFGLAICIVLAWPDPELLIAVGTLNAILLAYLGFLVSLPALHGFAVGCSALAWMVAFQFMSGAYQTQPRSLELLRSFLTGQSATALGVFAAAVGGVATGLARANYKRDAQGYFLGAAVALAVSGLLAAVVGFTGLPSDEYAPPTLLVLAVTLSVVAWFIRDGRVAWAGSVLLLVALVQAVGFVDFYQATMAARGIVLDRPILLALLLHSFSCLAVAGCAGRLDAWHSTFNAESPRWSGLVRPFTESALATSLLAAPTALLVSHYQFGFHASCLASIAMVWLGIAVIRRWPLALVAAEVAATVSLAAMVAAQRDVGSWRALLHPRHVAVTLVVLSAWCVLVVIGRWFCRRWPDVARLFNYRDWPAVDRVTGGVLIAILLCIVTTGCAPGMLRELGQHTLAAGVTISGYQQAFDSWMWAAWAAVTVAMAVAIWERFTRLCAESILLACAAVPLLVAGPYEMQIATLSALRWSLAVFGLLVAACWAARQQIFQLAQRRADWPGLRAPVAPPISSVPLMLVAITALPIVVATTMTVVQVVNGVSLGGPQAGSFFANIGAAWSYGAPLALVATTLLVIAVRDARPSFAAGGSIVFQYLASLACLLPPLTAGAQLTGVDLARLGQWNALALGTYAMIWLALRNWIEPSERAGPGERAEPGERAGPGESPEVAAMDATSWTGVRGQVVASLAAVAGLAIAAACGVIFSPGQIYPAFQQLGQGSSFLTLALVIAGAVWLHHGRLRDNTPHIVCGAGICLAAFVAAATGPYNLPTDWLSFHVLMVGWTLVVASAVGESWWLPSQPPQAQSPQAQTPNPVAGQSANVKNLVRWSCVVGAIVSAMSVFAAAADPTGPWWACGATAAVALAAGAAALRVRSQPLAYVSTILLTATVTYVWLGTIIFANPPEIVQLAYWWILTLTLSSAFWLAIEINSQQRRDESFQAASRGLPAHRFFAAIALIGLLGTTLLGTVFGALQRGFGRGQALDPSTWWGLAAIIASGLLLFALLWDRRTRTVLLSLYAWGFAAQVMLINATHWRVDNMILAFAISVSGYVALTGAIWRRGANLAAVAIRLGISDPVAGLRRASGWLPILSVICGGFSLLCGLGLVWGHPDRPQRVLTAPIPVLIAIGLACLAQSTRKQVFQFVALVVLGISCVFLSWADIEPGLDGAAWLSRVIRLLMVCCAVSFAYTMLVARRRDLSTDWQMSLKRVGVTAGIAAIVVLASVLIIEGLLYLDNPTRGAPINDLQLGAVSVVMMGLIAALIAMAILPGRDPLGLTEQGRMAYVYAAQVAGALLFAHIYLTRPAWFGQWAEWWPYIILLIAFAGAGVGELFQRTGHRVLADPLQQTGTFLPVLPAIGMWFVASSSDYSLFLFGAGILYVGLSIGRKSLASALAAGVAANGALWSLLDDRGFALLSQPQLWLIPPALSVLIATEINRQRIPESTTTGLRYACMMVIYLSSAGEIFIRGIGQALWPPMVLLGLSLCGALAGIVLRIRAFLYLGITFMLLSMISMVWHAARSINHVWPWWAFGIGLGLCILVFFGFFEKNRDKITATVERLKQWEP